MPEQAQPLETWAVVEVMGHKKFAGYVSEQVIGSNALIRVDVPETDQGGVFTRPYTKLIGPGSIYMLTPCTEDVARAAARTIERYNDPIPVDIRAPRQLSAGSVASVDDAQLVDDDDDR
ncbi:MAG TPA: hypothetical protein VFZ98_05840 [Vicinamibacterales bacterium]